MRRVCYLPSLFFSVFFLYALFCITPVHADEISDAVSWLETQTNADGSYAGSLDVSFPAQSTAEVLRSYHELNQESLAGVVNARSFIDTQGGEKTEILARKIIAKAEAGGDTAPLLAKLIVLQNPDGGFGDQAGYQSRVIDTTFALNALGVAQSGSSDAIGRAISYLLNEQAADGGFSHSSVNQNSVYETALASIALQHFRFNYNLTAAIDGASDFLLKNQLTPGDWGSNWETAYALLALIPVTSDVQHYQPGVDNLKTSQAADGSWGQDVYATALALRAIHKAANVQVPQDPTTGTFTGQIFNANTGQPLQGVTVKLTDVAGFELVSSADGSFSMEGVSPGEHTLSYSAAGFTSATQTATIVVGKFTSLGTIQLTPLADKGVVFGVVRDAETSQPLASVAVNITGSTTATVTTNAQGYFSVEVEPGTVSLTTQIDGYDPISGSADIVAGQRLNFSPLLNITGTTPVITTVKTKVIVVDAASNLPLEGVSVKVTIGGTEKTGTTDSQGKLLLEDITAGSLTIDITSTGYQAVSASTFAPAGSVIDLGVVRLNKAGIATKRTIKGVVTDAVTGAVIAGATIKIDGTNLTTTSDAAGFYTIEDTGLANFTIIANADGYLQNNGLVKFENPGLMTVNIELGKTLAEGINIERVRTDAPEYFAYKNAKISTVIKNTGDVTTRVQVFAEVLDSNNNSVQKIVLSPEGVQSVGATSIFPAYEVEAGKSLEFNSEWSIGLTLAGDYKIRIDAISEKTGQLLSQKFIDVIIKETKKINISIIPTPDYSYFNIEEDIGLKATINNLSNIPIESRYTYSVLDPNSKVIKTGELNIQLLPVEQFKSLVLNGFNYKFDSIGTYTLFLEYVDGLVATRVQTTPITVASSVRVDVIQSLTPETVFPDRDKRIKIKIRIKGVSEQ